MKCPLLLLNLLLLACLAFATLAGPKSTKSAPIEIASSLHRTRPQKLDGTRDTKPVLQRRGINFTPYEIAALVIMCVVLLTVCLCDIFAGQEWINGGF